MTDWKQLARGSRHVWARKSGGEWWCIYIMRDDQGLLTVEALDLITDGGAPGYRGPDMAALASVDLYFGDHERGTIYPCALVGVRGDNVLMLRPGAGREYRLGRC